MTNLDMTTELNNNCTIKISPCCRKCSIQQAKVASSFAGLNENQTQKAIKKAEDVLEESKHKPLLVQHVVRRVADTIIEEKGLPPFHDIYRDVKEISNNLAQKFSPRLSEKLKSHKNPFEFGLQLAAAGNIIDFGAKDYRDFNLEHELNNMENTSFDHYDIDTLKLSLSRASHMLLICDNCGEIVFDMLLLDVIKEHYPDLKITAAFRDKPVLNDATVNDARAVGFDKIVPIMSSGSLYPGTVLPETSAEFKKLYDSVDIILSKGQGNFETLLPGSDERIFFILKIKCDYMADLSGVKCDSLVLMQGGNRPSGRNKDISE
ncbi:MAG: DUF89 family protein [Spirochaetales bacterium]|nr:DUF89 family protein [Spirochaetales bacterium]